MFTILMNDDVEENYSEQGNEITKYHTLGFR